MNLPPDARRLDVAATRAAFAAGTLATVGDDAPHRNAERDAVVTQANRPNDYAVGGLHWWRAAVGTMTDERYPSEPERTRRDRLRRWQVER